MRRPIVFRILNLGLIILTAGCQKDNVEPQADLQLVVPINFPAPVYQFEENKVTQAGFDLGHRLFYEDALSVDNSINCGTCHQPFAAFANLDHSVSHGVDNCFGTRNAPPLFNLIWQQDFMWDGGVHHIEVSGLNALVNPCEMANSLDQIVAILKKTEPYPALFKKAFGTEEISSQRLFKALTQFTGMMISSNSRYDKYVRHEKGGDFTTDEIAGYLLFQAKCGGCHAEPLFTDKTYRSNGLDVSPKDTGRDSITQTPSDGGKFRVPSLRNIELTRPYMHDGRFYTLEDVLEHYNSGVKAHVNLDPLLKQNNSYGILLEKKEQSQIISFLKTLTDHEFIKDKRFAER